MIRASGTLADPNKLGAVVAFWTVGAVVLARRLPRPWSVVISVLASCSASRQCGCRDREPGWQRSLRVAIAADRSVRLAVDAINDADGHPARGHRRRRRHCSLPWGSSSAAESVDAHDRSARDVWLPAVLSAIAASSRAPMNCYGSVRLRPCGDRDDQRASDRRHRRRHVPCAGE